MKVRFNRPVSFEGHAYDRDAEYDLPEGKVKALGNDVTVLDKSKDEDKEPETKQVDAAPQHKQVQAAPSKK